MNTLRLTEIRIWREIGYQIITHNRNDKPKPKKNPEEGQMLKISYSFPNGREQTGFQKPRVSNQLWANEAYCTLTEPCRNEIRLPGEILLCLPRSGIHRISLRQAPDRYRQIIK